jgi:predicted O-methyltransferase YrrM
VRAQAGAWAAVFALLAGGLAGCGLLAARRAPGGGIAPAVGNARATADADAPPSWRQRAVWAGLAMVPSGLLVAVTAHLSTDVASAPLLWVLPLALFLLTFVLAFRDRAVVGQPLLVAVLTIATPFAVMSLVRVGLWLSVQMAIHLTVFFAAAMICHRALYLRRPPAARLTEFYLWMSFGGMLGGLLTGLAAPLLFDTVVEYRLLLVAAVLCAPAPTEAPALRRQLVLAGVALAAGLGFQAAAPLLSSLGPSLHLTSALVFGAALLVAMLYNRLGSVTSAGALAAAFLVLSTISGGRDELAVRSFFGVNYVRLSPDGDVRLLVHGSTIHGAHRLRDPEGRPMTGRPQPTTYYHDEGGINLALRAARAHAGGRLARVGVIGLGTGAMACQAAAGEAWTFFEIDREVVGLARRPELFPFLSACAPDARIVVGDGRLTIRHAPEPFDVIILDAFSSDAVPAHLLTREAFAAYAERLAPGGAVIAHVSNGYMELRGVAAAAGLAAGMTAASASIDVNPGPLARLQIAEATSVVAMSRDPAYVGLLMKDARWTPADASVGRLIWTDDYANIVGAMLRKLRGAER